MKILLTGASGFLGNIIYQQLSGAHEIICLGRNVDANIKTDLTCTIAELPHFDMVIHAAGKAHMIAKNKVQEEEFFDVNVNGTLNLLAALEKNRPETFVFISSVAVYGLQIGENIDEQQPLLAKDPYGKSKIEAEQQVVSWGLKHGVKIVILRLPLIIGPNPPGNLGALKKAIKSGYYFRIGNGNALRSVVRAVDLANFIPHLLNQEGIYNLTCLKHPAISEIDSFIASSLNKKIRVLPDYVVKALAAVGNLLPFLPINTIRLKKLTNSLTFSSQFAVKQVDWKSYPISANDFE